MYGEDHPSQVVAFDRLALALRRMQRQSEALDAAERATAIAGRILAPGHPLALAAARTRVATLWDLRRFADARDSAERLLQLSRQTQGTESPATASAEELFAVLLSADGELGRAAGLYSHALTVFAREYGEVHAVTLRVARNEIGLFRRQGDERRAREATMRLVSLARAAARRTDLDPVILHDLASLALRAEPAELRDPALGLELAARAVAATEHQWLDALATLARAHEETGDPASAIATLREAFELPDCLLDASLARRMKRLLLAHGSPANVDSFLAGLATKRRELYPDDRELEADTLLELAIRDRELGRLDEAVRKLESADALLAPRYSISHPDRIDIALSLAEALQGLGRTEPARAGLAAIAAQLARESNADPSDRELVAAALAKLAEPGKSPLGPR